MDDQQKQNCVINVTVTLTLISEYKRIKKLLELADDEFVTRDMFRAHSSYPESQVNKYFNSYKAFRKICENSVHESKDTRKVTLDPATGKVLLPQQEFDFVKTITGAYIDQQADSFSSSKDIEKEKEEEEDEEITEAEIEEYDDGSYIEFPLYSYNTVTKDYIFKFEKIPNIGKVITLPITQVDAILQAYSKFDDCPETITQIALKHSLPAFTIKKILYALGVTHDSLPLADPRVLAESYNESTEVQDLLALRKANLHSKFQAETWKTIQSAANKWNHFEAGVLNPFRDILETWEPKVVIPPDATKVAAQTYCGTNKETFIVTISDLHFGVFTHKDYAYYSQEDWTIEKTQEAVKRYADKLISTIKRRDRCIPKKCILLSLGDILHSISGLTDKGTVLETNPKGPLQFKIALNTISEFLQRLLQVFLTVEVKAVSGNHDSFADWVLFTAIEKAFKAQVDSGKLFFDIATERWLAFSEGNSLFILEHGYSPFYKAKVPSGDTGKEAYISRLILNEKQKRANAGFPSPEHNYFLMGDRHHYSQKNYTGFEFIQLPTLVHNDLYADHLNLHNRPKQLAFILDHKEGIIDTISIYL